MNKKKASENQSRLNSRVGLMLPFCRLIHSRDDKKDEHGRLATKILAFFIMWRLEALQRQPAPLDSGFVLE